MLASVSQSGFTSCWCLFPSPSVHNLLECSASSDTLLSAFDSSHHTTFSRRTQLFLELASVKRVGLASAMCSPEDRLALKDVADQIRRRQSIGAIGGGSAEQASGEGAGVMKGSGEATRRRLLALDAAVSTLGLQP